MPLFEVITNMINTGEYLDTTYCHTASILNVFVEKLFPTKINERVFVRVHFSGMFCSLTHWGRVTHICVSRLTITGSDNGLSPGQRQAIIWTNAGILLIGPLGANFIENSIEILTFSFTKRRLKVSSANWRPFFLGPNMLIYVGRHEKWPSVDICFVLVTNRYQCVQSLAVVTGDNLLIISLTNHPNNICEWRVQLSYLRN